MKQVKYKWAAMRSLLFSIAPTRPLPMMFLHEVKSASPEEDHRRQK
jgi:hypothetical protein